MICFRERIEPVKSLLKLAEPPVLLLYFVLFSSGVRPCVDLAYLSQLLRENSAVEASYKEGGRREALTLRIVRQICSAPSSVSKNSSASPMSIGSITHVPVQWTQGNFPSRHPTSVHERFHEDERCRFHRGSGRQSLPPAENVKPLHSSLFKRSSANNQPCIARETGSFYFKVIDCLSLPTCSLVATV